MGHIKKLCECSNFSLIEIVRHKVITFVSQKYVTEDDILVCTYCKITHKISISSVYFKQKMGLFKKSLSAIFLVKLTQNPPFCTRME